MESFRAFRIHQEGGKIVSRLETIGLDELAAGEVVVKVRYSTINYKDALAATGAGKILRRYPLVGGIDLSGEVVSSSTRRSSPARKCWSPAAACPRRMTAVMPNTRACRATGSCRFRPASMNSRAWRSAPRVTPPRWPSIAWNRTASSRGDARRDRRHRRDRRRRQHRHRHARGARLSRRRGDRQAICRRNICSSWAPRACCSRDQINTGSRPMEEALFGGAIDNVGGELLDLADAHYEVLGQHRQHRPGSEPRAEDHGDAVHLARREPAGHQFRVHAAAAAPRRCGSGWRAI